MRATAWAASTSLSPGDPDLHTNRGVALEKAGRSDEAKAEYAEAKKLSASENESPAPVSQWRLRLTAEFHPNPSKFECIGQGRSAWCKKASDKQVFFTIIGGQVIHGAGGT
jgi:hypothetical protein